MYSLIISDSYKVGGIGDDGRRVSNSYKMNSEYVLDGHYLNYRSRN